MSERLMGEESLSRDLESLSLSKRLVRSVSQKLRKKTHGGESGDDNETSGVSLTCLTLYGRGGGCKVGADTGEEFGDTGSGRTSGASVESNGYPKICQNDETSMKCFPYGKVWRKNSKKLLELKEAQRNCTVNVFLPDDILEMCLMRLPLTGLMSARLVCKKWRNLSSSPRFIQMRKEGSFQSPWLFLFGVVKDGYCSGEVHALDVSTKRWHTVDSEDIKGRFLFSVASIHDDVYVVGGCSSLTNFGRVDRNSFKKHKEVTVFNPLTKSWRKAPSMKYARSSPILGINEVSSDCLVFRYQERRIDERSYRSRIGGVSDVYEDPHRLSVRRHEFDENNVSFSLKTKPSKKTEPSNNKNERKFVLIAVGGLGSRDEPLYSGEIYDSVSKKWTEIQKLPTDFGVACSGTIVNEMFYVYSEIDKLVAYDLERGYWVEIQTGPFPSRVHEYYPKLITCSNRLFMISVSWCEGDGEIGRRNKAIRKLWELDLIDLTWGEVSTHPDAPMDWNAAFAADKNLIFGVEMFKIFGQVLDFSTMIDVSETGTNWCHISRNHMANELDASSCITKSMAVLHL